MVTRFIADLERPISRVRLENYRPPNGSDLDMVVNYFHNIELSEALYPTLQAFEIALRNSVHLSLSQHFQTPYWFDAPSLMPNWQRKQISDARRTLVKAGKPPDPDRIVAELHLGFWHSMFNSPFEKPLWRANRSALVGHVFPQAPNKQRNRQRVWDRIDRVRIVRNRVMHYEPIWYRARLHNDHAAILEVIWWISSSMHESIAMCDRFPVVLASRAGTEARVRQEIERRFAKTPHIDPA